MFLHERKIFLACDDSEQKSLVLGPGVGSPVVTGQPPQVDNLELEH